MLRDLACQFPALQEALARADATFSGGERLSDFIYPHPAFDDATLAAQEAALTATEVAQPALGAIGLGLLRVLERLGCASTRRRGIATASSRLCARPACWERRISTDCRACGGG